MPRTFSTARRLSPEAALDARLRDIDRQLRPDAERVRVAKDRAAKIIDELHRGPAWMYQVEEVLGHGSLHRGTGLNNFKDIDFLVQLNEDALRTRRGDDRSPRDTVQRMADAIEARRAGLAAQGWIEVRPQGHSVGVEYPASGWRIDLVPLVTRNGRHLIPRRRTNEWIETHPDRARARLEQACLRAPHTKIAVRLIKAWRRARGNRLTMPSYALELMVVDEALRSGASLPGLVCGFHARAAERDKRVRLQLMGERDSPPPFLVEDPDTGANVTEGLTREHRGAFIETCREARDVLEGVSERLAEDPDARVDSALKQLFIGRHG